MILDDITKMYQRIQELKTPKVVHGHIKVYLNFDKTTPTIVISDGQQKVELRPEEFEALKVYEIES